MMLCPAPRRTFPLVRCVLAALAIGLAFPGGALAQETLTTGKVARSGGFQLSLSATRAGSGGGGSFLSAYLTKRTSDGRSSSGGETSYEVDWYEFNRGIAFTGSSDLGSAHLKGVLLDHRGSIDMAFHATGRATTIPVPKHCTGSPGEKRHGVLRGSFALRADRLGTVKIKMVEASFKLLPTIFECTGGGGHSSHATSLTANGSTDGHALYVFASKPLTRGFVTEGVSVAQVGTGDSFQFSHSLTVLAPRWTYRFSPNLAGGRLRGVGSMRGTATYRGSPAGKGTSQGTLRGSLVAMFAAIGRVRPFAHGPVSAQQFRY